MKTRHLTAAAVLGFAALTLTACGPDATPSASAPVAGTPAGTAPGSAASGASGATGAGKSTAKPGGTASRPAGTDAPICGSSEKESDVTGQMIGLDGKADPRWTGVIKLTNTSGKACVIYGAADLRTDGSPVFTKLATGVLGSGAFATDRAHGTVLTAGESVYQPVTWLSSPPIAPNATCTTGSQLIVVRNDEVLTVSVPVKNARFCPDKATGSPQVLIGVPQTSLAAAQAQLQNVAS
ncbi:hypothetical protein P3T36_004797 [Kitasatospora sp. MAP12-15]|uniref:hypothetical protein n=1 Tax=unclassified Kitasatospora TaxID=2633591 RepID=UPI0024757CAC|nr:hypothetical protein [Kitasatospora sp. MAP12-44]MDH6110271.1 hypothetical protein [Kitasatospora sp. MAP12-44]